MRDRDRFSDAGAAGTLLDPRDSRDRQPDPVGEFDLTEACGCARRAQGGREGVVCREAADRVTHRGSVEPSSSGPGALPMQPAPVAVVRAGRCKVG